MRSPSGGGKRKKEMGKGKNTHICVRSSSTFPQSESITQKDPERENREHRYICPIYMCSFREETAYSDTLPTLLEVAPGDCSGCTTHSS